jgi:KipI family sensor histidine kinase inhibitor
VSRHPEFRFQGETGLLVYLGRGIDPALNARVRALARRLAADPAPGVREVVPAYASLLLHLDPARAEPAALEEWVCAQAARLPERLPDQVRQVEVPVVYGGEHGPDLEEVAAHTGLSPREVVRRHSSAAYPCYLLGFTPGFPYLGGLDPALATPRLSSPRLDLPPGVVGIAGAQTGLYPLGGPGGWRILGRTPLLVYDPRREEPCAIRAGDTVRFAPLPEAEFPEPPSLAPAAAGAGRPVLEVLRPGAHTTVQDAGRWGWQSLGVPPSGALDSYSLAAANLLAGNPPETAALELTLLGPRLKVLAPVTIAVAGADLGLAVDGRPAPLHCSLALDPGQVVDFRGPVDGARAVLAVAGGVAGRPVMGSLSAYPLGRLGGPLAAGQVLEAGPDPGAPGGRRLPPELAPRPAGGELTLRVVPGPNQEMFSPAGLEAFYSGEYAVSDQADRRGVRLAGPAVELDPGGADSIVSEPNSIGVVQVPPGGQPIILLREQTVGGYAKVATVIGPDLDRLARALPGTRLRFAAVEPDQALELARRRLQQLEGAALAAGA